MQKKLTDDERKTALADLQNWSLVEGRDAITQTFKFDGFGSAFAFMTKCALMAEKIDHHPEWSNVYNRVEVTLTTHSANGLTHLDINLAKFMDQAI